MEFALPNKHTLKSQPDIHEYFNKTALLNPDYKNN